MLNYQRVTEKKTYDYKMPGTDPPKRIYRMKQQVEHVLKKEGSITYLLYLDIFKNMS